MIKVICLIMFMSSACVTMPDPTAPNPKPKPDNKTPTAPKPPRPTQACTGTSSLLNAPARDKIVIPGPSYYDQGFKGLVPSGKNTIYLNYSGRKVFKGNSSGQSFIVCKRGGAQVGGSGISKERQGLINFYVKGYFKDAGIDIEISDKLNSETMLEMIIGGRYKDLGCGGNRGILGVAPLDIGNRRVDEIGFSFVNSSMSDYMIASTIAHEAGHTYGLDHINNQCGIMYYAITDFIGGFREGKIRGRLSKRQDSRITLKRNLD